MIGFSVCFNKLEVAEYLVDNIVVTSVQSIHLLTSNK